jgi:hypothetical protein
MSIHEEIKRRCAEGLLCRLDPLIPAPEGQRGRCLYVTPMIYSLIHGPWEEEGAEELWEGARAHLDRFITGGTITVPKRKRHKHANMARLCPPHREVWDFRVVRPKPGLRIFGRFAATDCFVATSANRRDYLLDKATHEGRERWSTAIRECRHEWRRLFPTYDSVEELAYPEGYMFNAYAI